MVIWRRVIRFGVSIETAIIVLGESASLSAKLLWFEEGMKRAEEG